MVATLPFVLFAMSVLQPLWEPAVPVIKKTRGLHHQIEVEQLAHEERERSPRRRFGVKAHLKSWATGDSSTVGMWRLCHAVCTQDGTNAGVGMGRLAGLATSERSSSEQNCARGLRKLLAATSLPDMIQAVPHTKGKDINSTQKSTKRLPRRRTIQERTSIPRETHDLFYHIAK